MISKFSKPLFLLICFSTLILNGCAQIPSFENLSKAFRASEEEKTAEVEEDNQPNAELASLAERLKNSEWIVNRTWQPCAQNPSVELSHKNEIPHEFRWSLKHVESTKTTMSKNESSGLSAPDPIGKLPIRDQPDDEISEDKEEVKKAPSIVRGQNEDSLYEEQLLTLSDRNGLEGWNSLILFAQSFPVKAIEKIEALQEIASSSHVLSHRTVGLKKKIATPFLKVPIETRAAAAEAWCWVLEHQNSELDSTHDLQKRLAPAGRLIRSKKVDLEVRGELIRGLCRLIPPAQLPGMNEAFEIDPQSMKPKSRVELRRAILEGCLVHAYKVRTENGQTPQDVAIYPEGLWQAEWDMDSKNRKLFGRWVALIQHKDAMTYLKKQLRDTDFTLRSAAITNLGFLKTPEAIELLELHIKRTEEVLRSSAAKGLAPWGYEKLRPFAEDESFRVRVSAIESLKHVPSLDVAQLYVSLIKDRNPQVQQEVLHALKDWPSDLALPVLFQGVIDGTRMTRQRSALLIRNRQDISIPDLDGSRDSRRKQIMALAREANIPTQFAAHIHTEHQKGQNEDRSFRKKEISEWLSQLSSEDDSKDQYRVLENLKELKRDDLPILDVLMTELPKSTRDLLASEILPSIFKEYEAMQMLSDSDVFKRRKAAWKIAEVGQKVTLSKNLREQLVQIMAYEQDRMVWRDVMRAMIKDATKESGKLALIAMKHRWTDIQLLGCEYAKRHPEPRFAPYLVPLLHSKEKKLQRIAIETAGYCRHPAVIQGGHGESTNSTGLRSLLYNPSREIRTAAALSLSRLGDDQGMAELTRLSYSQDNQVRTEVVKAMGDSGNKRFVSTLIRMSWTEPNEQIKREIVKSLETLVPGDEHPTNGNRSLKLDETVKLWVQWLEDKKTSDAKILAVKEKS